MDILKKRYGTDNKCSRCHTPMTLVEGFMRTPDFITRTQGCYQCRACGRLTCYNCSDNREPCECGANQWFERAYFTR
jgi:hypothetical protein